MRELQGSSRRQSAPTIARRTRGEEQVPCIVACRSRLCVERGFVAAGARAAAYVRMPG